MPTPCPCGSGKTLADCCGPFLDGTSAPATAEALMRSRYTAFTQSAVDYLRTTWHSSAQPPALDHAHAEPTMAAHNVVTARPHHLFHARAGMREARAFQHRLADLKALPLERDQVDAGHQQVATQGCRRHLLGTDKRGDHRQMFGLQQGDAAVAGAPAVVIAFESCARQCLRDMDADQRSADRIGSQADSDARARHADHPDPARATACSDQAGL
ncbi:MAG: hypothetical protein C1943_09425 [Halochromatium sp.]|nr:hypothetical protein [Halochromatium sp.]